MHRNAAILALLGAIGITSCNFSDSEATATALIVETPSPTQPAPTPEEVDPTATPQIAKNCPDVTAGVDIPAIEDVLKYGESFVDYLNVGGSIDELAEHAEELGMLGTTSESGGFLTPDLNGDDIPEAAIALVDWKEPFMPGRVYVAMCEAGDYQLKYASADEEFLQTVGLQDAFDLTGDGLDDLLIIRSGCGAHTCFDWVEVVAWHDGELKNRMDGSYFDLPTTSIDLIENQGDGTYQIVIGGNAVASVGAGPYHRRSATWIWDHDANQFRAGELEFQSSNWRVHFVHEGDRRFDAGDYSLALEQYNRAIHDDTLEDWPSAEWNPEYAVQRPMELASYARFRQMLASIKLGNLRSARGYYEELIENHPSGDYGDGFTVMGLVFWDEFTGSQDFDLACLAAQFEAPVSPTGDFAPLDYGYSNPTYTPEMMCPAGR